MFERHVFTAATSNGTLGGWVTGAGPPVLLLHGGPGLSYQYMDPLAEELHRDFRVASFQQRGLRPSTLDGPFTIVQAIDDVVSVLDALEWVRVLVVGHSWGGHLALRFAAAHPERLLGMLAVEPVGIVGDGGRAAFEAELVARIPKDGRERARALEEREQAGEATLEESLEIQELAWPAYFADPENAPPMPPLETCVEAFTGIAGEMADGSDDAAAALAIGDVRYGVLAGGASPIPWGQAARASAELSSSAFLTVVPGAGHFVWHESPGAVRTALQRVND